MPNKVVIPACVLLLKLILAESNTSSEITGKAPDYGLNQVKTFAIKSITNYYNQATEHNQKLTSQLMKYIGFIEKEGEMMRFVEDRREFHTASVNEEAEKLAAKGKEEMKPMQYFLCLIYYKGNAITEMKQYEHDYKKMMEGLYKTAMEKVWKVRTALTSINSALPVVLNEFRDEINACISAQCVEDGVRRAWNTFKNSRSIMVQFSMSFINYIRIYIEESVDPALQVNRQMENAVARAFHTMYKC